jgi:hypothetical protein
MFAVAGHPLPESLTRHSSKNKGLATGHDDFEKVHIDFATVADLFDDADIKMVKASEAQTAALSRRKCAEAALKRAAGNRGMLLKHVADVPVSAQPT